MCAMINFYEAPKKLHHFWVGAEISEPPLQRAPASGTLALEMSSLERASFGRKRNLLAPNYQSAKLCGGQAGPLDWAGGNFGDPSTSHADNLHSISTTELTGTRYFRSRTPLFANFAEYKNGHSSVKKLFSVM